MKKLTLDLDRLEIATFEPLAAHAVAELRGTVDARAVPTDDRCSAVDACLTRICDTLIC
jgi:hypothetical protein